MAAPTGPPASRAVMPARGWLVLGAVVGTVSAVIVGVLFAMGSPKMLPSPPVSLPKSLPDLGGPRSVLVPELTLPPGARPYVGKNPTPPGFEFWEVPATHRDLVTEMRSELPIAGPLNGMPWCGELSDAVTSWAWGSPDDTIGVSLIDGGVMIRRFPDPQGCRP
jgi:hypothetical protein